ncbi:hypothetical protein MTR67_025604 [Solanum verrucosum]|uniref:Tf2-1-like SH3-like domain-containing protein n=1 Tax=Solanum verrucosum TaxID=315347 RepID=A0AAF0QXF9_SOLVR|nr:hypothetical protein MTR67_025604 [Solanum verrucosum]
MKGVMRFGKNGKLSPKYEGRYRILKRIGKVAYELNFPTDLAAVHPVFHISLLKKCVGDPASIVPLESVSMKDSLSYEDVQLEILDRQVALTAPSTDRRRTHGLSCRSVVRVSKLPQNAVRNSTKCRPTAGPTSVGQVTDRGSCLWMDAPKAQL